MSYKIIFSCILAITLTTFSFGGEKRKTTDEKTKTEILKVLEVNEKLFESFLTYDGKKIEQNAGELRDAIGKISNIDISKLLRFAVGKLSDLKVSNEKDANNRTYNVISMALIHIIKTYNIGDKYNAYSCPMVKMKWIQNSKKMPEIHNPYAANMPRCGDQDTKF